MFIKKKNTWNKLVSFVIKKRQLYAFYINFYSISYLLFDNWIKKAA